jgi:large subunit ribosomal protein L28
MFECAICGKAPQFGQNIRHVHSGSWERKAQRTKRRFLPNLQVARMATKSGVRKVRVCTKCIKAGKVVRAA